MKLYVKTADLRLPIFICLPTSLLLSPFVLNKVLSIAMKKSGQEIPRLSSAQLRRLKKVLRKVKRRPENRTLVEIENSETKIQIKL